MKNKFLSLGIVIGALSLVGLLAACGASVQPAPGQEAAALSAQASSPQSSASELPVDQAMHHPGMDASAAMTHTMPMTSSMPADHAMHHPGMDTSAAMTHTMPMTSSMQADHAMHHPGMDASATMTHTMPMAGGMDHSAHMAQMTEDMEAMMQRMAEMHSSMTITHTMPMTGAMPMAGAPGSMDMTHEQHMGRMMIMMGQMMQMMGEMHMPGGMSGMGSGGMNHSGMCDMMGGEGCKMMESMDHSGSGGMDHGSMGSGMCDMMGGEGCEMMGNMGAGSAMTPTQAMTTTTTLAEAVTASQNTANTRTSEAGSLTVSATPLNLADLQAATLDFALVGDGPGLDPGVDMAPLASLRFGSQQLTATAWQPETGVLSFPASDLTGVRMVTLMIRNLAGAPLRTFTWTLSP